MPSSTFRWATRWLVVAAISLVCVLGARAACAADALPYSKGFLLTGGYVASGVDLTTQTNPIDPQGFSTGTRRSTIGPGTVSSCVW